MTNFFGDLSHLFHPSGSQALEMAYEESKTCPFGMGTNHLILGILRLGEREAVKLLTSRNVTVETFRPLAGQIQEQGLIEPFELPYLPYVVDAVNTAGKEAIAAGDHYVDGEYLLLGILKTVGCAACVILHILKVDLEELERELRKIIERRPKISN